MGTGRPSWSDFFAMVVFALMVRVKSRITWLQRHDKWPFVGIL